MALALGSPEKANLDHNGLLRYSRLGHRHYSGEWDSPTTSIVFGASASPFSQYQDKDTASKFCSLCDATNWFGSH